MSSKITSPERAVKKTKMMAKTSEADDHGIVDLSYVEFYSGVGGWTMALQKAIERIPGKKYRLHRLAALDHSDLCTRVFEHNFGSDRRSFAIERLSLKQVEAWHASIWAMSPPCQPHTRQHSNQAEDSQDPRSTSFLHLVKLIEEMQEECLPSMVCLENVVGFESSSSFRMCALVLEKRGYRVAGFHLNPTQVDLPNDRPRFFCVALRKKCFHEDKNHALRAYFDGPSTQVFTAIPELLMNTGDRLSELPPISAFLNDTANETLTVPSKTLSGTAAWCFDIVTPSSQRSSCFTHSYGRYNRGTGSILYTEDNKQLALIAPEDRDFDEDWMKGLDLAKLRYFSGIEMTRLMGFSATFSFPSNCSHKQQWKLIGNSLNVSVASRIVELGLRLSRIEEGS